MALFPVTHTRIGLSLEITVLRRQAWRKWNVPCRWGLLWWIWTCRDANWFAKSGAVDERSGYGAAWDIEWPAKELWYPPTGVQTPFPEAWHYDESYLQHNPCWNWSMLQLKRSRLSFKSTTMIGNRFACPPKMIQNGTNLKGQALKPEANRLFHFYISSVSLSVVDVSALGRLYTLYLLSQLASNHS